MHSWKAGPGKVMTGKFIYYKECTERFLRKKILPLIEMLKFDFLCFLYLIKIFKMTLNSLNTVVFQFKQDFRFKQDFTLPKTKE